MSAYYNEFDAKKAAILSESQKVKDISQGRIDERSIESVKPSDVSGYIRAHFFAGIGGWDLVLNLAGWPDSLRVWTASCPCQPFSDAGKKMAFADQRHLWPVLSRLIEECRPDVVIGEQVSSKGGLAWFDHVYADLEAAGYAVGALDTCAAGIGAPHLRQRLYWVGIREGVRWQRRAHDEDGGWRQRASGLAGAVGPVGIRSSSGLEECAGERRDDGKERASVERAGGSVLPLADGADSRCDDAREHGGRPPLHRSTTSRMRRI